MDLNQRPRHLLRRTCFFMLPVIQLLIASLLTIWAALFISAKIEVVHYNTIGNPEGNDFYVIRSQDMDEFICLWGLTVVVCLMIHSVTLLVLTKRVIEALRLRVPPQHL